MSGDVFIEIVVDAEAQPFDAVKYTLDGCLGAPSDQIRCVLLADWSGSEDHSALRLLREEYGADARVTLAADVAATSLPATFRLYLPAGWRPGRALAAATREMQQQGQGLRWFLLPDGQVARLEATAAFERAMRVRRPDEDLDDVVDQVSGSRWSEGLEAGFSHPTLAPPAEPEPADRAAGRPDGSPPEATDSPDVPAGRGNRETVGLVRRAVRRARR